MRVLTAGEMRGFEQAAMESGVVTGRELMERAGEGVVASIFGWRPELGAGAHSALVLCGPGNNGGDGFVVARLLAARGWSVTVFLYGDAAKLPPDAAENARRWLETGAILPWSRDILNRPQPTLYIDALFGGGLSRSLPDEVTDILTQLFVSGATLERMVSVDAPSGLCLDSGRRLDPQSEAVHADLTVTFQAPRVGHYLAQGPEYCGEIAVVDIGLDLGTDPRATHLAIPDRSLLRKESFEHKYNHGHALILSGGMGKTGAARLAARAALRIGAGLVTLGAPPNAMLENACHLTAIMLRRVKGPEALAEILTDTRLNALCLGPGLGVGPETRALVGAALAANRGVVLDADALTSFKDDPEALFAQLHPRCVLTPHQGEFGRLFPDILARLTDPPMRGPAFSKVDATREAAKRAGCVVLFKGPDTVIADPEGRVAVNAAAYDRAAPWLATAGSGDVLAGLITGLLARGFSAFSAAETGAWLHVETARRLGPGLIAEDLPETIPAVLRDLLAWAPPEETRKP